MILFVGKLSADVSGHKSKASVAIETQVDGLATIAFTPVEEGLTQFLQTQLH